MKITWHGQSLFEVIAKTKDKEEVRIITDPFDKKLGIKLPKLKGDVLIITHGHYDHNNKGAVEGKPFLIDGPGEYEVKRVFIKGIPAFHDSLERKKRGQVTVFTIEVEGIKICHLSDIGQKELTEKQLEEIGEVDILMIPVGGIHTLDAKEASEIVNQVEPQIVIPMHYKLPKLKEKLEGVDKFLKVLGVKNSEKMNKLSIRKKDLSEEKMKVVILNKE